jgi:hypothetical protein
MIGSASWLPDGKSFITGAMDHKIVVRVSNLPALQSRRRADAHLASRRISRAACST